MTATVSPVWRADDRPDVEPGWRRTARERRRRVGGLVAEGAAVALAPLAAFLVFRIRVMAPTFLPDSAMHTSYIVHPADFMTRYTAALSPTTRMREVARVGFLIPARLSYLVFGALGGFLALRYVFALIAIVPTYVLLRRLYGRTAGAALGVIAILSSPVVLTAFGTDYPDGAVLAYVLGAIACLALSLLGAKRGWLAAGCTLATMAVWSHTVAIPLVAVMLVGYVIVGALRNRTRLLGDVLVIAAVGIGVTALLSPLSELVFGRFDFFTPTWDAYRYVSQPSQIAMWHAKTNGWLIYLPYLLVPPAAVAAWAFAFLRRPRSAPTAQLFVGLVGAGQVLAFAYFQFLNHVQTLEQHYFSSTLWSGVTLMLAVTVCELARPLLARPWARWVPVAVLVGAPLAVAAGANAPQFSASPGGVVVAAVVVVVAAGATWGGRTAKPALAAVAAGAGVVAITLGTLALTVTAIPSNPFLPGSMGRDPIPAYNTALGGSAAELIDHYRVTAELPGFVGNATYQGELLLMWWPRSEIGVLTDPTGMYHDDWNSLPTSPPVLSTANRQMLDQRRPAELLLLSTTGTEFPASLQALAPYQAKLLRETVLRSGDYVVHAWLLELGRFDRRP